MPYSTPTDASSPIVFPSQGRPGHRRSFSHITAPVYPTSSSSPSVGSLPRRKPTTSAPPAFAGAADDSPQKKPPTFQLGRDDDDDDSSDETPASVALGSRHDDDDRTLPPLRLKLKQSSFDAAVRRGSPPPKITLEPPTAVPFPRSSPTHSPSTSQTPLPFLQTRSTPDHGADGPPAQRLIRPSVTRTTSTPILLSNGKPLKSSLKGSSSSPHIPFPPQSLVPSIMFPDLHRSSHQRARSAPSTPHLESVDLASSRSSSPLSASHSPSDSPPPSPIMPHKNVHFPSQEEGGLATVRVFNRSAKPASLSRLGEDTETETEGESSAASGWNGLGWGSWGMKSGSARNAAYPFPRLAGQSGVAGNRHSPLGRQEEKILDVDVENSAPVPARGAEKGDGNVYLESIGFVREVPKNPAPKRPLVLAGTLLVRNVTYQKTVAVRYTMDDWHTTNDILATYEKSLGALPARFVLGAAGALSTDASAEVAQMNRVCSPYAVDTPGADVEVKFGDAPAWDRFRFEIRLEDLEGVLEGRTMWLVGRYSAGVAPGVGVKEVVGAEPYAEWWDNNGGANYRVAFRRREADKESQESEYKRGVVVSAPSVYPSIPRPTATSPPPKSYPAPPQISASVSLPSSLSDLRQYQMQQQQHQPHQAAVAQSTLARLRKLNLRNYAAPAVHAGITPGSITNGANTTSGPTPTNTTGIATPQRALSTSSTSSTDSMDSLSTASSATSVDSTPLQTPTQDDIAKVYVHQGPRHDLDLDVLGGADGMQRSAADEDTDDGATPTFSGGPARPRWGAVGAVVSGAGAGAKDFVAAAVNAGAGAFRLHLGAAPSPASSGASTPTPTATPSANANTPAPTAASAMDIGGRVGVDSPSEMGTSPPFSAMADMGLGVSSMRTRANANATAAAADANANSPLGSPLPTTRGAGHAPLYWPWGSFGDAGEQNAAAEERIEQQQEKVGQEKLVTPPLSPPVASLLSDIKEKSADGPMTAHSHSKISTQAAHPHTHSSATGQIVPPHRRRPALPHAHTASPSGSASSSGSDSTGGRRHHYRRMGSASSPTSPLSPSTERAGSFPFQSQSATQSQLSNTQLSSWGARPGSPRPGSPRPNGAINPGAGGGVRSPLRLSPAHSFADLGTAAAVATAASTSSLPFVTPAPESGNGGAPPPTSPGGQDDAVYQAFVRQWCFAQAPGPTVGASVGGAGAPSTTMPIPMSGAGEGPRLVVG